MRNFLYMLLALVFISSTAFAQDTDVEVDLKAKGDSECNCGKGSVTGAVLFGQGQFLNGVPAPASTSTSVLVPSTRVQSNFNDSKNIAGMELRYFITDEIALKLSGGAIFTSNPAVDPIPGIGTASEGGIPAYAAVQANGATDANINLGGEYHLGTMNPNLFFWVGLNGSFYHGRRSAYNPNYSVNSSGDIFFQDFSERSTNVTGWGIQQSIGVEYYLAQGLYVGVETRPVNFTYAYADARSAADLPALTSQSYNWSIFSQTFIKLGFKLK